MLKIYKNDQPLKKRDCEGCKKPMRKKKPCIFILFSWKGSVVKLFFHNKDCYKTWKEKRYGTD